MQKNLRNVAFPGTGIPLSWVCYSKVGMYAFIFAGLPVICLIAAVNQHRYSLGSIWSAYRQNLLNPQDWFWFWRLNCLLASWHCLVDGDEGYKLEDKWTFLQAAHKQGIPISPFLQSPATLIAKHRNEEGGLGYFAYSNASEGGNWILQEALSNSDSIAALLPKHAPLSTLRIVTASDAGLRNEGVERGAWAMSCVWRAGREGAMTDHSSILFDVDMGTGELGRGTTNAHWYKLGFRNALQCPLFSFHDIQEHPDTGLLLTGKKMFDPLSEYIVKMVEDAHSKLAPGVPLIGWDVALTTIGPVLLEGNFSCNFFRGTFDKNEYFELVEKYMTEIEERS